ncbi:hypothetical protein ACHAXT_002824 [Thalassiosira profunda]
MTDETTPQAAAPPAAEAEKSAADAPSRKASTGSLSASKDSAGASKRNSLLGSTRDSMRRRSSGLFAAARASFYRSRGQSGASVETLRGTSGADFEGYATVHRGDADGMLALFDCSGLFCCKKKDGLFYLLIKGYHCFVYKDENGKSPKYAIELMNRRAVIQPSHGGIIPRVPHPGAGNETTYTTIHLETGLGDVEYKFTFANMDDNLASQFCTAVSVASNEASTEQVRKRLGHEKLLTKRSSVKYANAIGAAKAKDQPDAPVGAGEVLAGMPLPTNTI